MQSHKGFNIIVLFVLGSLSVLLSCKKVKHSTGHDQPVRDSQKIKLKEVVIQGLPSPYFHFVYDSGNFVTELNHESDFYQYKIEYINGRVNRVINKATLVHDTLLYHYTMGNVTRIDLIKPGQGKYEETVLKYDLKNRLSEAIWKKSISDVVYKRMIFHYNSKNNLSKCEIYFLLSTGLEKSNTYVFEQFDNERNVASNDLLKETHYLYLPQVQLQKNNPLKAKLYGIENDFEMSYTYQYRDSLPNLKTSRMTQTRGIGSGTSITGVTRYVYY